MSGLEQLEELHRPWIDEVAVACEACGEDVRRIAEVGDVWLDAGIVPFSTLGWENPDPTRRAMRPAPQRADGGRSPRSRLLGAVVPGRVGLGDAGADPALVLLAALHVRRARRPGAVPQGPRLREDARRAGPRDARLVGEHDRGGGRLRPHGRGRHALAVLRAAPEPEPPLRLRPGTRDQAAAAHALELARFLADYANIAGWTPEQGRSRRGAGRRTAAARSLARRTHRRARRGGDRGVRELAEASNVVRAFDAFVEDVSNWYIRRSRRRFWDGDEAAFRALWYALVQGIRVVSPVMPFLSDHLWRALTAPVREAPESVFLAGWPEVQAPDATLVAEVAELRRVVELGRQARSAAGIGLRQPLRALVVEGASLAESHADELARGAPREGGRLRHGRRERAPRQAQPAPARAEARRRAGLRAQGARGGRLRAACRTAASARRGTT